jgi:hypothetical protein
MSLNEVKIIFSPILEWSLDGTLTNEISNFFCSQLVPLKILISLKE